MRRLAGELGVEAMSLYNYVPNKAAVLDGIVEIVLGEIELAAFDSNWQECIRVVTRSYRDVALKHPNVVPLISMRPFNTIASMRPVEFGFAVLANAGFDPESALHAFRTLAGFTTGYSLAEAGSGFFGEVQGVGQLTTEDLPQDEFPNLHKVSSYLETDHDKEFEFGLDIIIAGMEMKLRS
jgi:AcrR family transcriptional regulator